MDKTDSKNLLLQLPDDSESILAEIDSSAREVQLTRENQPLMDLLAQRRKQSQRVSLAEAKKQLGIN